MARNIIYAATWTDEGDTYQTSAHYLCFRHATLHAMKGHDVKAKVDDSGQLDYAGCEECRLEHFNEW